MTSPGVGQSFIPPEQADAIRARGLPVAAHLSPATEPQSDDDGRRADLTDWRTPYLDCQATVLELRQEIKRLKMALDEWHRSDLYSIPGVDWLLDARADRAAMPRD